MTPVQHHPRIGSAVLGGREHVQIDTRRRLDARECLGRHVSPDLMSSQSYLELHQIPVNPAHGCGSRPRDMAKHPRGS